MVTWILAALGLFVVQIFLVPFLRYPTSGLSSGDQVKTLLGNRDDLPEMSMACQRAARALDNYKEAMPVFLTLALLTMIMDRETPYALSGAMIFLAARVAYVPIYVIGIPVVRTLAWTVGWVGMIMMIQVIIA